MSSKYYLVARDTKTNDFEMKKDFSSLKEVDIFTTKYHNSGDLAKKMWKGNIVPSQDIDFFIILPIDDGKRLETTSVLYSNSKEIIMIDREEIKENTLKHFCEKTETAINFLNKMRHTHPELYSEIKNSFLDKDNEVSYKTIREAVLSFTEYKKSDKEINDLYRLVLEKDLLEIINDDSNDNQISIQLEEDSINTDRVVETLELLRNFDKSILEIRKGKVYTTNNIYTNNNNLQELDSLLDQRIGFILYDYLNDVDEEKNKSRELKIIEILSSDIKTLNNTYKYAKNINTDIKNILGDNNGCQYRK